VSDPAGLLAESVARGFGGKARFVAENYGESELAKKNGVTRYPAIFVDDILVAKPKDFGFYGKGEGSGDGRYTPLKSAASHERFRSDLTRMIELVLQGRREDARAQAPSGDAGEITSLPAIALTDLEGKPIARADLEGRTVLVEFWATWCPPCQGTLRHLADLQKRYGDRLAVVAVAIESDEADVRRIAASVGGSVRFAMGTPDLARAFGDVTAVPTLFLFDPKGATAAVFYGAPPTLHADAEAKLRAIVRD
jgi:thiol-disulfide isomerase/thioredoxin